MSAMTDLGSWLVVRVGRGAYADAIAGDLAEGVRAGRSAGWYWGQVVMAVGSAWLQGLQQRRGRILFAAVWGAFWPVRGLMEHQMLVWWLRGTIGLSLTARQWSIGAGWVLLDVTYLWAGLLVYAALSGERWRELPLRWFVSGWMSCLGLWMVGRVLLAAATMTLIMRMGAAGLDSAPYFMWSALVGEPVMAAGILFVAIGVMIRKRRGFTMRQNGAAA